jgi:hypothetical protein
MWVGESMRRSCSSVSSGRERENLAVESRKDRNSPVRERVIGSEDMKKQYVAV